MDKKERIEISKRAKESSLARLIRYAVVAFIGFLTDYAALFLLNHILGLHYLIAVPIAFVLGLAVNYVLGIVFVFRRAGLPVVLELSGFLLISLIALVITELAMLGLTDGLGVPVLLAKVIAATASFLWNYCARQFLLYRKTE